ncbi:MAG TPA: ATP phosphoribosyltransferase regulatory subunit, partial [Oscillospiraceae bacterium]|nr:ATP phosphoribosyltransferase regulatory subunit [Oscillospiraceae bacterium]
QQGKQRELTQAGVELLGSPSAASDAEVIALAAAVLQAAGLTEFTLCLGHSGFLENLLSAYQVDTTERALIKHLFNKKDFVALKNQVSQLPLAAWQKENILRVPSLRGGREVLTAARELLPEPQAALPLTTLAEVWSVLEEYGVTKYLQLDLGLVRLLDYYTGMVFEGYTGGLGYALCGGGRYDQLLDNFGPSQPAVGFAVSIDHLITVLTKQKKLPALSLPVDVAYGAGGRAAAVAVVQALRAAHTTAALAVAEVSAAEARRQSTARGAQRLLYYSDAGVLDLDLQKEAGESRC